MAVLQKESLAAYLHGSLSLNDFQWEPHLRPHLSYRHFDNSHLIPVIDLQSLSGLDTVPGAAAAAIVKELSLAAQSCGFFQIINHGVPLELLQQVQSYTHRLFSLPLERREEIARSLGSFLTSGRRVSGYSLGNSIESSNKWWVESLRMSCAGDAISIHQVSQLIWRDVCDQKGFCEAVMECSKHFTRLAEELTELLMQGLGLHLSDVEQFLGDDLLAGLKLSYYPPCPQPELTLGLPPHTDVSIVTILLQDEVGGLQVCRDDTWINIRPRCDALVVNLGDIFQIWSNDKYKSGAHRVVLNKEAARYSTTFFYNPRADTVLSPLSQLVKEESGGGGVAKFRSISNLEFRQRVFNSASDGECRGVDHLRI